MKTAVANPSSADVESADFSQTHRRREQGLMLLLATPAFFLILLLLVIPVGWLFWQSFYADGFTLEYYRQVLTGEIYWSTFTLTFRLSFMITLLALVLGYPVAYAATVLPHRWTLVILLLVILPFWTSVLVRVYAWTILLQRTGVVNDWLMSLGLIDNPLHLIYNELGTVIGTVHILLPFMILPLYSTMQKIPRNLMVAGESLGGSPFYVFRRVFFPLSLGGVIAGSTLVFILCLGFYLTPELMGGGDTIMVSMVVARNVEVFLDWGAASAVSAVLFICVLAILYVASRVVPVERIMGAK